jgi:hypothetical protein
MAGLMTIGCASLGSSPETMSQSVNTIAQRSATKLWLLIPRTVMAWGLISVVASFILLGLGVMRSLMREPPVPDVPDTNGNSQPQ